MQPSHEVQSALFSPIQIGALSVAGRLWKSATSETRAAEDGSVTDSLLSFYDPIAAAGTPLIVTGNLFVSEEGKSTRRQAGADSDERIAGLRRWANLVHSYGGLLFAQLNHCGRQTLPRAMGRAEAVSASDVREKILGTKPRALHEAEIAQVVQDFAAAAERCCEAGFDGIQIHAGHGYLIHQFLTPYTNRRTDQYGGCFEARLRFLREVYTAIRDRVGQRVPLILKLGGHDALPGRAGLDTAALVRAAVIMQEEGIDAIEISVGHYESGPLMVRGQFKPFFEGMLTEGIGPELSKPRRALLRMAHWPLARIADRLWPHEEGFNLSYAEAFKAQLSVPVACVGGFQTRAAMEAALEQKRCDVISVARAMIADPLLYRHLRDGTNGPRCEFCNGCIARAGSRPIDCYSPKIRAEKQRMLENLGFTSPEQVE